MLTSRSAPGPCLDVVPLTGALAVITRGQRGQLRAWLWSSHPGALHSLPHKQHQGAARHPDPVCPDSWGGREVRNGCFQDQPGDFPAWPVR